MSERPREGESVHYVAHPGLACVTAIAHGTVHPDYGDDHQWCLSVDLLMGGTATSRHHHVPHGHETGHWHDRKDCRQ